MEYSIFACRLLSLCLLVSAPVKSQEFSNADECRTLVFTPEKAIHGKRLLNHVIRIVEVTTKEFCENVCYMEPNCVSINLDKRVAENGNYKCELNNVTHDEHELREEENYFYHAAESACVTEHCKNNATCQSGFTDKGYRCLCTTGFKGENCVQDVDECTEGIHGCSANALCNNTKGSYNCSCKPGFSGDGRTCKGLFFHSCKDILEIQGSQENKAYSLLVNRTKINVYCHMTDNMVGCGGGGWTLVMKIDGRKPTFHFDSKLWSDMDDFNPQGGETGFDLRETKLPTYWNTSFTKICLGMELNDQSRRFIAIQKQASSLYSLIADGQYRDTSLDREMWKSLIGSEASLQPRCNMEGFNAVKSKTHSKARIGIIANSKRCNSCDSRIGFGTGGSGDDSNTCGNEAMHGGDNGNKHIKAMGYILVQ